MEVRNMWKRAIILAATLVIILVVVFFVFSTLFAHTNGDPYFAKYYVEFEKTPTPAYNYSFSPPVSMYHALVIAFESDLGWSAEGLENITINVELDYCSVSKDSSNATTGFQVLYAVTHPVADWSPQQINDTTSNTYVWVIRPSLPDLVYGVDAVTAEMVYGTWMIAR